jgi:hypothetical protein
MFGENLFVMTAGLVKRFHLCRPFLEMNRTAFTNAEFFRGDFHLPVVLKMTRGGARLERRPRLD